MPTRLLQFMLLLTILVVACNNAEPVNSPPTAIANEPPTVVADTATAVPTVAAQPETPPTLPPPPTMAAPDTPVPATPEPEPTVMAETAVSLLTKDDFGAERNPLTGEVVADTAVLQRRPIACKLSNFPAQFTRPQSGINSADILFEHLTEGGLTRFTAIFYSQTPENIGPIRSARLIDIELPAMYDAALCYSGASIGVQQKLNRSDFSERVLFGAEDGYYRTGENKPWEHTFYARPAGLWSAVERRGLNNPPTFGNNMHFTSDPPAGGEEASELTVDYESEVVVWRYDEENGRYWRTSDGVDHVDALTGEPMNFRNVVVVFANTVEDANICEQITDGRCVALSLEIQLWGVGRAVLFRDGRAYETTWNRANRNDMLTYTDFNGNPVPLQIGNTMVQLVSLRRSNVLSYTP